LKNKLALLSVSDKTGLVEFAHGLARLGFTIVSTGGTKKTLQEAGLQVMSVSEVTGFPEILDGRVKTLHPLIHGGILARRDLEAHRQALSAHGIGAIDLVAVNLYPFAQTIAKPGVSLDEAVENIDIGGPAMVRAAAKNYRHVAVVVNPVRYPEVLAEMEQKGDLSEATRFALSVEAFAHTAEYDAVISGWLQRQLPDSPLFPKTLVLPYTLAQSLRYGENPQQKAAFYREAAPLPGSIAAARQLHGRELSFNNLNDLNAAWEMVQEFAEPAAVAVKHANPCGVAVGRDLLEAYAKAFDADPVSIFGGIVAVNRTLDAGTAARMSEIFLEVIIAPDYEAEALSILSAKKDLRLLSCPPAPGARQTSDYKKVSGGLLVQETDQELITAREWQTASRSQPDDKMLADMLFAMRVVKHVKSNAIVLAKNGQTIGIGAGQMNRVGAARIAIAQAGEKAGGAVLASDAFFPFRDTVDEAAAAGVAGIVQPGGSLKDSDSIAAADESGLVMVITGRRLFKH
jgi:phosphoribosylaminoimidazolecarboxamide formyltransferase/IMP cyclohydrolase